MKLEEIKPERRLSEVHRSTVGLCRGKIGYVAQWDKVMAELVRGNLELAIRTRQRRIGDYEAVIQRIETELRYGFATLLVKNSALVAALRACFKTCRAMVGC